MLLSATMRKMIGYMITWTTYGTWLQGEEKGYVKNGRVLPANPNLLKANKSTLKGKAIKLSKKHRRIVKEAIEKEADKLGQKIYAMAVCSNHVHIVTSYVYERIGKVAGRYKRAGTTALRTSEFAGRVWAKGFDKRFCYDKKSLLARIKYVRRHN